MECAKLYCNTDARKFAGRAFINLTRSCLRETRGADNNSWSGEWADVRGHLLYQLRQKFRRLHIPSTTRQHITFVDSMKHGCNEN